VEPRLWSDKKEVFSSFVVESKHKKGKTKNTKLLHSANKVKKHLNARACRKAGIKKPIYINNL
jgi:hypothetical protein